MAQRDELMANMRKHVRGLVFLALFTGLIGLLAMSGSSFPLLEAALQDRGQPGFPDLVGGLKATPGCLGVETARTEGGKSVIFAWFEDKQAVRRWYDSAMHQSVMRKSFPDGKFGEPLKGVPENTPIMAIASITLTDKPQLKETTLPISQIAIELYQPVTGGLFLGGRFAPESLKVPGIKDYTPKSK